MTFLEEGVTGVLSYLMITRSRDYPDAYRNALNGLQLTISPTEGLCETAQNWLFLLPHQLFGKI